MPHIGLRGVVRAAQLFTEFTSTTEKVQDFVFKSGAAFLRHDRTQMLVEALVVEGHLKQEFLVQIRDREEGVLIRLYPGTPVQRTPGVKRFLVWFARRIQATRPHLQIGTTNLQAELEASPPPGSVDPDRPGAA